MNKPYTNTNRLTLDERGVSEVIGSILVFGIVVMLLSIVQTQAIPNANEEVEFEHSQIAQEDLSRLHSSISRSALQGESGTVSVKLGTTYPTRLMFYNPPPVIGRLSASDPGLVTLSNVEATDQETADYLDSSTNTLEFKTRHLSYSANYNHYQNAPETVIEGTRVAKNHRNTVRVANPGQLVSGNRISLVLLSGDVSEGGVSAESFSATPVSGPASPVTVTNTDSQNFTVEIPTQIPEETWVTDLLADEIDDSGDGGPGLEGDETNCNSITASSDSDNDRYIVDCEYVDGNLTLHFEQGENYQLQMAEVNLGEHPKSTKAKYIVPSGQSTIVTAQGTNAQFSVDVRDKYNNPVAGVPVSFKNSTGDTIATVSTGPNGKAIGTWSPPELGNYDITAEINDGNDGYEKANLTVSSISPSRTPINPSGGVILESSQQSSCGLLGGCHAVAVFNNTDDREHTFKAVRVSVYADVDGGTPPNKTEIKTSNETVTVDVGGKAESFESTIKAGNTKEFNFKFDDGNYSPSAGDFFVFEVAFENGESATYFIPVGGDGLLL